MDDEVYVLVLQLGQFYKNNNGDEIKVDYGQIQNVKYNQLGNVMIGRNRYCVYVVCFIIGNVFIVVGSY